MARYTQYGTNITQQTGLFRSYLEEEEKKRKFRQTQVKERKELEAEEVVTRALPAGKEPTPAQYTELTKIALEEQEAITRRKEPPAPSGFVEAEGERITLGERGVYRTLTTEQKREQARMERMGAGEAQLIGEPLSELEKAQQRAREISAREAILRPITSIKVQQQEELKRRLVTSTSTNANISQIATDVLAGKLTQKENGEIVTQELSGITITDPAQLLLIKQMRSSNTKERERANRIWREGGGSAMPASAVFGAEMTELEQKRYELGTLTPQERKARETEKKRIESTLRETRQERIAEERRALKTEEIAERKEISLGRQLGNLTKYLTIMGVLPRSKPSTPEEIEEEKTAETDRLFKRQMIAHSSDLRGIDLTKINEVTKDLPISAGQKIAIHNTALISPYKGDPYEMGEAVLAGMGIKLPEIVPFTSSNVEATKDKVRDMLANERTPEQIVEQIVRETKDNEAKPKAAVVASTAVIGEVEKQYEPIVAGLGREIEQNNIRNDTIAIADMQRTISAADTFQSVIGDVSNLYEYALQREAEFGMTEAGRAEFARTFPNITNIRNRIAGLGENPSRADVDGILLPHFLGKHKDNPELVQQFNDNVMLIRTGHQDEVEPSFVEAYNTLYQTFAKEAGEKFRERENLVKEYADKDLFVVFKEGTANVDRAFSDEAVANQYRNAGPAIKQAIGQVEDMQLANEAKSKVRLQKYIDILDKDQGFIPTYQDTAIFNQITAMRMQQSEQGFGRKAKEKKAELEIAIKTLSSQLTYKPGMTLDLRTMTPAERIEALDKMHLVFMSDRTLTPQDRQIISDLLMRKVMQESGESEPEDTKSKTPTKKLRPLPKSAIPLPEKTQ